MKLKFFLTFLLSHCFSVNLISSSECNLANKCRTVDNSKDVAWAEIPGNHATIQDCVDHAHVDDTCMIATGTYHEQVTITNKNNLTITADPDKERPVMDGTVVLNPKAGSWKIHKKSGQTVCVGRIKVFNNQHPFQLFLMKDGKREMMTNARWPNALWSDRNKTRGAPQVFYNEFWGKSDGSSKRGTMVDRKVGGVSPLAATGIDMKGAMAVLNTGSFNTFVKPVKHHTAGHGWFTYDDDFGAINFKPGNGQYFLDSSEALLDIPGEWYYNMAWQQLKFIPWSGVCPKKGSDAVRGRVIDYFFDISHTTGLLIKNLDFFASNLQAVAKATKHMEIDEIHLDSLRFKFPSSSKRMLQKFEVPKLTQLVAHNYGKISVVNCEFFGSEGSALYYWGKDALIQNNLFKWNDWSGQMGLTKNGGCGTIYSTTKASGDKFVGNTMLYNGASAGFRPAGAPTVTDNLVVGQCDGEIMHDGSGIQVQSGSQPNSLIARNWVLDSPKAGIRFDDSPKKKGSHGTMHENVVWKASGYMVKGDHHNITRNLALINNEEKKDSGGLMVIHSLRRAPAVMNRNTVVEDNAAWLADGGIDMITKKTAPYGRWEMSGIKKNNYYGNNSFTGGKVYDGSVVLNGKVIKPDADLPDMLVDVSSFDFRPKKKSILTSTGKQIGPYRAEYKNNKKYHIAGRKQRIASFPIPPNESIVHPRDCLMFQPAFRCTNKEDKHVVYIVQDTLDFPPHDGPTTEMTRDNNVIVFKDIGFEVISGRRYKWRVDCVEGKSGVRRSGQTWKFTFK